MLGNFVANKGGNRKGTPNLQYQPCGYYADDPQITTATKSFAAVIKEVRENGFTASSSLHKIMKNKK